jgi:hypothetical protein
MESPARRWVSNVNTAGVRAMCHVVDSYRGISLDLRTE